MACAIHLTKESAMNRRTALAVAVGAALFASTPFVQAQQAQPGPYALPPYLQNVEQDRTQIHQDRQDMRQDNGVISQDHGTLRSDESQRSSDLRALHSDERSGNTAGVAQERAALGRD